MYCSKSKLLLESCLQATFGTGFSLNSCVQAPVSEHSAAVLRVVTLGACILQVTSSKEQR